MTNTATLLVAWLLVPVLVGLPLTAFPTSVRAQVPEREWLRACIQPGTGLIRIPGPEGACTPEELPIAWAVRPAGGPMAPSSPNVVGCVQAETGLLRVIAAGETCGPGEKSVAWSVQGPPPLPYRV